MVSTHLKNISQIRPFPQAGVNLFFHPAGPHIHQLVFFNETYWQHLWCPDTRDTLQKKQIAQNGKLKICFTRWAPTNYKWSYKPYKWPYKWVTGVITPFITSRGPTLQDSFFFTLVCEASLDFFLVSFLGKVYLRDCCNSVLANYNYLGYHPHI